jgi:hypothetical protein
LKLYFYINFLSTTKYIKWSCCFRFPYQHLLCKVPLTHTPPWLRPSSLPYFRHRTILGDDYRSRRFACSLLRFPLTSLRCGLNIFLSTFFADTLSLCLSVIVTVQLYALNRKYIVLRILVCIIIFLDSKLEDKD